MNIDQDYDNDGNNIVPCPICNSVYCPSKEKGKCPEEDEFIKAVKAKDSVNEFIQEKVKDFEQGIKENVWGYCCEKCNGSGGNSDLINFIKCSECKGTGIVRWNYELAIKQFKTVLTEAYNRGVQDSIKCVPSEEVFQEGIGFQGLTTLQIGHNNCRQQTLDNLNNLIK